MTLRLSHVTSHLSSSMEFLLKHGKPVSGMRETRDTTFPVGTQTQVASHTQLGEPPVQCTYHLCIIMEILCSTHCMHMCVIIGRILLFYLWCKLTSENTQEFYVLCKVETKPTEWNKSWNSMIGRARMSCLMSLPL